MKSGNMKVKSASLQGQREKWKESIKKYLISISMYMHGGEGCCSSLGDGGNGRSVKSMMWFYALIHSCPNSTSLLLGKHCYVLGIQRWRNKHSSFHCLILSFLLGEKLHNCFNVEWRVNLEIPRKLAESLLKNSYLPSQYRKEIEKKQ